MDLVSARLNMLESQVRVNDVTDPALQEALRQVAREAFCAPARAFSAYAEVEPEICPGRALMKPRDIGKLLMAAAPKSGETALAVAAPYAAALLAHMGLKVTAQEGDARAVAVLGEALSAAGVELVLQDLKTPSGEGYDLIISEGAVSEVPQDWIKALKLGGRLVVVERKGPVGHARLYKSLKTGVSVHEVFDATPPLLEALVPAKGFQF